MDEHLSLFGIAALVVAGVTEGVGLFWIRRRYLEALSRVKELEKQLQKTKATVATEVTARRTMRDMYRKKLELLEEFLHRHRHYFYEAYLSLPLLSEHKSKPMREAEVEVGSSNPTLYRPNFLIVPPRNPVIGGSRVEDPSLVSKTLCSALIGKDVAMNAWVQDVESTLYMYATDLFLCVRKQGSFFLVGRLSEGHIREKNKVVTIGDLLHVSCYDDPLDTTENRFAALRKYFLQDFVIREEVYLPHCGIMDYVRVENL